jgi:predicted PurR-regulated permease PerM
VITFNSGRYSAKTAYVNFTRPIAFWITMLAATIAVVVLLREVLLPFVAGRVLAYLLDPLASRLERLGITRSPSDDREPQDSIT